ncbi:MAG TPA: MotA/TolQ/ExbB proton channel family protein [Planctomycetota bacterium]|nr:MotA/TolQ/ExbB proton channel family protein [Planctomycetota bacterium]
MIIHRLISCAALTACAAVGFAAEAAPAAAGDKVDLLREGMFHWPMIPLWFGSVLLLALLVERARATRERLALDQRALDAALACVAAGDDAGAIAASAASDTALGRAWAHGLRRAALGGATVSDALGDAVVIELAPLRRRLQAITTIGVVSPLFGLFATVLGIIISFGQMGVAGGADKAELARAIGIALFGTAGGIILAIPAIIGSRFFTARIAGYVIAAEREIARLALAREQVRAGVAVPRRAAAAVVEPLLLQEARA